MTDAVIPCAGMVAISLQGRDKGALYIAVRAEKNFVYLSDGKTRPLSNPKKKNIKHVRFTCRNAKDFGLGYPWNEKSFDVNAAYILKRLRSESAQSDVSVKEN